MKNVLLALTATAALSLSASVSADQYVFKGDTEYAGFCQAALQNDVELFNTSVRRSMKATGLTKTSVLRRVVDNGELRCNGLSLAEFSKERNAEALVASLQSRKARS